MDVTQKIITLLTIVAVVHNVHVRHQNIRLPSLEYWNVITNMCLSEIVIVSVATRDMQK